MDKGRNEAEKREVATEREGRRREEGGKEEWRERRVHRRVERRRGGGRANVPHCQLFLTLRLCLYA